MAENKKKITPIKKPYLPVEITDDELIELAKCASDPIYFITNYVYIQSTEKGAIKFKLFPYQYDIIKTFAKQRFTVMLAARQMGKCVTSNTIISKDGSSTKIGELIYPRLSFLQKIYYCRDNLIQYLLSQLYK